MRRKGFTLVELLIVCSLFAVISISIFATFSSGFKVLRRLQRTNDTEERLLLRLEKLSRELRQVFVFKDITFSGSKDKISFAAIIDDEIRRLNYCFDADHKAILRSTDALEEILAAKKDQQEEIKSPQKIYLANINGLTFSYFYFDIEKKAYLWKDEWSETKFPIAVKITIITENDSYTKNIFIPTA